MTKFSSFPRGERGCNLCQMHGFEVLYQNLKYKGEQHKIVRKSIDEFALDNKRDELDKSLFQN